MTAHEYAQNLALEGVPLNAISRATGLSMQDITYLRPRERRSYGSYKIETIPAPVQEAPKSTPPGAAVLQEMCRRLGVRMADVQSKSQARSIAWPRQAIMFELYVSCPHLSTPMIGRMVCRSDHTTVLHGVSRHANRIGLTYGRAKQMRQEKADELGVVLPAGNITKIERRARLAAEGRV